MQTIHVREFDYLFFRGQFEILGSTLALLLSVDPGDLKVSAGGDADCLRCASTHSSGF